MNKHYKHNAGAYCLLDAILLHFPSTNFTKSEPTTAWETHCCKAANLPSAVQNSNYHSATPSGTFVPTTCTKTLATWTAPTATDNCCPVNVTSTRSPGSGFPVGTTAATFNAVDGRGNGAAPCIFNLKTMPPGHASGIKKRCCPA